MHTSALRLFPVLAFAFAVLALPASAQTAPVLLAKYNFEDIPAFIPDWGAGVGSTYKPATGWKTPILVSLDSDNPHAGLNCLRFDAVDPSTGEKIVHSPAIKLPPIPAAQPTVPRKIKVRLFARATGLAESAAGIRILERNDKGASLRLLGNAKCLVEIPNSSAWIELTAEGVLHNSTRSLSFMVVNYQPIVPASIWIDDVSIELEPAAR